MAIAKRKSYLLKIWNFQMKNFSISWRSFFKPLLDNEKELIMEKGHYSCDS